MINYSILFMPSKRRITKRPENNGYSKTHCNIICRISIGARRTATGEKIARTMKDFQVWKNVLISDFCKESKRLKRSYSEHKKANYEINRIENKVNDIVYDMNFRGATITAERVYNAYLGRTLDFTAKGIFSKYLEMKQLECEKYKVITPQTVRRNSDYARYFTDYLTFIGRKDLQISEVNVAFAKSYFDYLKFSRNFAHNSCVKAVQMMRSVVNFAVDNEYVTSNKLVNLRLKKEQKEKFIYLNDFELQRLENHGFIDSRLQMCADMYLLQCYIGFAHVDLSNFCYESQVFRDENGFLYAESNRQKTGKKFIVPLHPTALRILEKYGNDVPKLKRCGSRSVMSLPNYNRRLSEIAKILRIDKKITSHTARCTAGMRWYNLNYSERQIEAMMGASMEVLKRHYVKTTSQSLTRAFLENEGANLPENSTQKIVHLPV